MTEIRTKIGNKLESYLRDHYRLQLSFLDRHGHRDSTLILLMFRHGLRVSEAVALQWAQVDFNLGTLHVNRLKNGVNTVHPLHGPELRALRQLQRTYPDSPYLFNSERKAPMTDDGVRKLVTRAGVLAALSFPVHPHMLRHACGYYLASQGQDTRIIQAYLGHREIKHTVLYTQLAPGQFTALWKD